VKDESEAASFARRRDLFSDLSVVFIATTSLAFAGAGGRGLGRRGHSNDKRRDLNQMPDLSQALSSFYRNRMQAATR